MVVADHDNLLSASGRRVVRVDVHFELLVNMMSNDFTASGIVSNTKGLPPDSIFVGSAFDIRRMTASLFFAHKSFDPVIEGDEIPARSIEFSTDYAPVDLLKDLIDAVNFAHGDQERLLEDLLEVTDKAEKWLKENDLQ